MIKKVAFIGHRVTDMDRAKKFYGEVLGLDKTSEYEGKWCEFDTPEGKTIALDTFSPEGTLPVPRPAVISSAVSRSRQGARPISAS